MCIRRSWRARTRTSRTSPSSTTSRSARTSCETVCFFSSFFTLEKVLAPQVEWYKSLCASNESTPRYHNLAEREDLVRNGLSTPLWRQPMGKLMVSQVNFHTNATLKK